MPAAKQASMRSYDTEIRGDLAHERLPFFLTGAEGQVMMT
jgi:hypothetical protein